jgi:HlyD family secretion protein
MSQFGQTSQSAELVLPTPEIQSITALGRLEPASKVVRLSAPTMLTNDRIAQLLVERGDQVQAGQVIAVLESHNRLQKGLLEAKERVSNAQAKLAQVQAGAKTGEIRAQQAEIDRLEKEQQGEIEIQSATIARRQFELKIAQAEYNRFLKLYQEGAISVSNLDQKRLTLETTGTQLKEVQSNRKRLVDSLRAQLDKAKATLNQVAEVRTIDVQVVQTEVNQAVAAMKRAEAELREATIYTPIAGQVLEIYTQAGEAISENGIIALGRTDQMEVVTEVYQSDIGKISHGQTAVITGEAFTQELRGIVRQIGYQVTRQAVFNNQPGENLDQRVVEVRIRLNPEDSKIVSNLTNLQVQVAIKL